MNYSFKGFMEVNTNFELPENHQWFSENQNKCIKREEIWELWGKIERCLLPPSKFRKMKLNSKSLYLNDKLNGQLARGRCVVS